MTSRKDGGDNIVQQDNAQGRHDDFPQEVPRLFRIMSFSQRARAFERVKNVIANKFKKPADNRAHIHAPSPRYPWTAWTSKLKSTLGTQNLSTNGVFYPGTTFEPSTSDTHHIPVVVKVEVEQRVHTAELFSENDVVVSKAREDSKPNRWVYPKAIGSERAAARAQAQRLQQAQNGPCTTHQSASEPLNPLPPQDTTFSQPMSPSSILFPAFHLDEEVVKQEEQVLKPTPIPNSEDDEILYPRRQTTNLPWDRQTRGPTENSMMTFSEDSMDMSTVTDKSLKYMEEGRSQKAMNERRSQRHVEDTEDTPGSEEAQVTDVHAPSTPQINPLPAILPLSPIRVFAPLQHEQEADGVVVDTLESSVREKGGGYKQFLAVPTAHRRRRWSVSSDLSGFTPSEPSSYSCTPYSHHRSLSDETNASGYDSRSDGDCFSDIASEAGDVSICIPRVGRPEMRVVEEILGVETSADVQDCSIKEVSWLAGQSWEPEETSLSALD